jgi:hypothetical protein
MLGSGQLSISEIQPWVNKNMPTIGSLYLKSFVSLCAYLDIFISIISAEKKAINKAYHAVLPADVKELRKPQFVDLIKYIFFFFFFLYRSFVTFV